MIFTFNNTEKPEGYLVDTNIFLEILLEQEKTKDCEVFLQNNRGNLFISDFSLHSIGVILFRENRIDIYNKFLSDVLPMIEVLTLSGESYKNTIQYGKRFNLDFDDSYQVSIAIEYGLTVVTMDKDFQLLDDDMEIKIYNPTG